MEYIQGFWMMMIIIIALTVFVKKSFYLFCKKFM